MSKLHVLTVSRQTGKQTTEIFDVEDIHDIHRVTGTRYVYNASDMVHKHYINKLNWYMRNDKTLYAVRTHNISPMSIYVSSAHEFAQTMFDLECDLFYRKFITVEEQRKNLRLLA